MNKCIGSESICPVAWTVLVSSVINPGYREGWSTNAKFQPITGFSQLSISTVVVADQRNNCLRMVDRDSLIISSFNGQCEKIGFEDGIYARFSQPYSVLQDPLSTHILLVTDMFNDAVRLINIFTWVTETLIKPSDGLNYPSGLAYDFSGEKLLISNYHYISEYSYREHATVNISGNASHGYSDGPLSEARFHHPMELVSLTPTVTLVADQDTHRLKLIDMISHSVTSFCTGGWGNPNNSDCALESPRSIMEHDGFLFIGQERAIRFLPCKSNLAVTR